MGSFGARRQPLRKGASASSPWERSEPRAREARMSKPFRDSSSRVGLDVVVTLPAPVVEEIERAAKERGETVAGWRRAGLIGLVEGIPEVSLEDLVFDVRMALLREPATKGMDEFAMGILADGIVKHLVQSRLRFPRMAPLPLHSAGYWPEPVGSELLRWTARDSSRTPAARTCGTSPADRTSPRQGWRIPGFGE